MSERRKQTLVRILTDPDTVPPLLLRGGDGLDFAEQGASWSARVIATGGSGSYTYTLDAAPAWISGAQVGNQLEVSGAPVPYGGDGDVVVTVNDGVSPPVTRTFHVTVGGSIRPPGWGGSGQTRGLTEPILIRVKRAVPFEYDVVAACSGVTLPIVALNQVDGTLPSNTTVDSGAGVITSTGEAGGEFLFTVRLEDGAGQVIDLPFKIVIEPNLALTASLPDAIVGQSYSGSFTVTGGIEPYTFEVTSGALPSGLILLPDGTFHAKGLPGAASAPGTPSSFDVTVRDAHNNATTVAAQITVTKGFRSAAAGRFLLGATDSSGDVVGVDFLAQIFGDGSDGSATLNGSNNVAWAIRSGSKYTMTRDAYCIDMTISNGVLLETRGFRIYGTGTLTLDGCGANTIRDRLLTDKHGNNAASGVGAATGGAGITAQTVAGAHSGGAGGVGASSGAGTPAGDGTADNLPSNGGGSGTGGPSGAGGSGTSTAGGSRGNDGGASTYTALRTAFQPLQRAVTLILGGSGGGGGGFGGNNGSSQGGNGGGGGAGGGVMFIAFYRIKTSSSTAAGCISVSAGNGGNGFCSSANANIGGGGGGTGGGGGYLHLIYAERAFTSGGAITGLLNASGGNGGNGAPNTLNAARNGNGGRGGTGGNITVINVLDSTVTTATPAAPTGGSGTTGATGGASSVTL